MQSNSQEVFFALVRAGLWEQQVRLSQYNDIHFAELFRLAEEQSVVGLVAAGLEQVADVKPPKDWALQLVGQTLQLELRNTGMNHFIEEMVGKMHDKNIHPILVKGQGIAQCYEKPLWRACGDVDFLLGQDDYDKAKAFLAPRAESVEKESGKHQGMNIGLWTVEVHGDQHCGLSARMDRMIDEVQREVFERGSVRPWMNGKTKVFLPSPNNDIIIIFTHFLKHFYKGGLGMRQICDWARLLWTYRSEIDVALLEKRLRKMGLMSEWKAFGAFAVDYLGMPVEALPLYEASACWKGKAKRINAFVMTVGNMGHNRGARSSVRKSFIGRKTVSFSRRFVDFLNHALIFPFDSLRFFPTIVFNGLKSAAKGIG
ncbi:MAG: nucleotidyltransferase family protein [Bacteroidales bacterium]|nr:nucleotidyltransferase family protein [Bacteroidales bacterium]